MTRQPKKLINFVSKFIGTVRFGNDHFATIMGYGDLQIGNILISRVYYVEGLGHNLFYVGQFCDSDLEVAFRKSTFFVHNIEGVDLLSASHGSNLYTISMKEMMKSSPICKSKDESHKTKPEPSTNEKLQLLHMDLCGPMRVESIHGKKYILVIVNYYTWFTWVKFLGTKDETPEVIIKILKQGQVSLQATVRYLRTNNGTKFINQTLRSYTDDVRITHKTSVARTPQQNSVVERLPAVSPFLCSDDSESEPANELLERHVSLRLYDDVASRWRDRVRFCPSSPSGSLSPDTTIPSTEILVTPTPPASYTEIATASPACISTPVIIASSAVHSRIWTTARKSTLGLRPVMMPPCSAALRRACRVALSLETSSSDTSSGSSSDLTSRTSKSSFTASLQGTQISPEDHLHHSSEAAHSPSVPLTSKRPQCSDYTTPTSSSSAGPSWKRSRSSATSIPSIFHIAGALSPTRADLLPPYKRYRGTSAMHSNDSSDEGSLETHTESDMDSDISADIKAEAATTATVDGLGIKPVLAGVKMGFEPRVDVATGIDILDELLMPDAIERLGKLEEGMQEDELRQANRNARLIDENQSQNGDDNDNGSGRNGNHGNNNGDGNQNERNGGARRNALVAKVCTYKDFLNCQPRNFSSIEGVVGLARWFEKMESVFCISNCSLNSQVKLAICTLLDGALTWWNSHVQTIGIDEAYEMPWKDLMKLLIEVYCPRNEIQKLENELWNLCVKGTDVVGYTRRF
ncbi:retrovirus-related pol polyprotein from transposon TNT 1-94 [Tanacetum coccineum]